MNPLPTPHHGPRPRLLEHRRLAVSQSISYTTKCLVSFRYLHRIPPRQCKPCLFISCLSSFILTLTPQNRRVALSSATPFTPTYVKDLVTTSADPAQTYASRVQGRQLLLENPARPSKASKERAEKKAKRLADKAKRAGAFASRTAQKRGLWRLRPEETKYDVSARRLHPGLTTYDRFQRFLPLHLLWMGYMSELLALSPPPSRSITQAPSDAAPNAATMHARLVKADFHGSLITGG